MQALQNRNFLIFWIGEALSLLGDQFYVIALPWLVLQLTGDALAVGLTFALAAIPRALFLLFGGVRTDQFSPRMVLIAVNAVRLIAFAVLAVLVLGESVETWMLYAFAAFMGAVDAVYVPAQTRIVAHFVDGDTLQDALSLLTETMWLAGVIGPIAAGLIIASFAETVGASGTATTVVVQDHTDGVGVALAVNAVSFAISIVTLFLMRAPDIERASFGAARQDSVAAYSTTFNDAMQNVSVRNIFALVLLVGFIGQSLLFVGVPVMALRRYEDGVTAFGILMGALGLGLMLGTLMGSRNPDVAPGQRGWLLLGLLALQGVMFILLGVLEAMIPAAILLAVTGFALGYVLLVGLAWMTQAAPEGLRARISSLYAMAAAILYPVAAVLAGLLVGADLRATFIGLGVVFIVAVVGVQFTAFLKELPASEAIDAERLRDTRRRMPHEVRALH